MMSRHMEKILWFLLLGALAVGLKYHYSIAGSDDLNWILSPTAEAVRLISGIAFDPEAHAGFVNRNQGLIIAPACAGVNFLIISMLTGGVLGILRLKRRAAHVGWFFFTIPLAYIMTILVNAVRITASMILYEADIYSAGVTPEAVHRLAGAAIYLMSLYVYFYVLCWLLNRFNRSQRTGIAPGTVFCHDQTPVLRPVALLPLFFYLSVTVGVPLVNHPRVVSQMTFLAHSSVIVGIGVIVYGGVMLLELFFLKYIRKIRCHETDHPHCRR